MAPTLLREGPWRFYFYLNEGNEPAHVHVQDGRKLAKSWLQRVEVASSKHFAAHELNAISRIVAQNRDRFLEVWNERFPRGPRGAR
jgi:hypothetical protein